MQSETLTQHYTNYYRYELPEGIEPSERVEELYERVMRNDKEALQEVLRIMMSCSFYLVNKQLRKMHVSDIDTIDDAMQNAGMTITQIAFRGFPEAVTPKGLFGWLLGVMERSAMEYGRKCLKQKMNETYDTEENSYVQTVAYMDTAGKFRTPENHMLEEEYQHMRKELLGEYMFTLQNSDIAPHKLLTYCYATVLPQLARTCRQTAFIERMLVLSSRKNGEANSSYNAGKSCFEGEIARNSTHLIKWAIEAMDCQSVEALDKEFLFLYDLERIADRPIQWGEAYKNNLEQMFDGRKERTIIITETYKEHTINNWPPRVAAALLKETEKRIMRENAFLKRSAGVVEEMLR